MNPGSLDICGVIIKPAVPMHMVNESGHTINFPHEGSITPHPSNVHTPIGTPPLRGVSEDDIHAVLTRSLSDFNLNEHDNNKKPPSSTSSHKAFINTQVLKQRIRAISTISNPSSDPHLSAFSKASLPVPRNPPNSLASGISNASSRSSSIQSIFQSRVGHNTPASVSPINVDENGTSPFSVVINDQLATPTVPGASPAKSHISNSVHPWGMFARADAGTDISLTAISSSILTAIRASTGVQMPSSYLVQAAQELNTMILTGDVADNVDKLKALRLELQAARWEGDRKITGYGKMLEELEGCACTAEVVKKRLTWNLGSGLIGEKEDEDSLDAELYQETLSTIEFLREQAVKRGQDLAIAQRIVEEKLKLVTHGYSVVV